MHTSFSILPLLAERKLITLVAPVHIETKVRLRLPEVATRTGADPDRALEVWETVHRPLMRFVEVGDLMIGDERVSRVALKDEEDVPVAQLGVLLAPSLVLTRDRHLTKAGIGERQWADALLVMRDLAELDGLMYGTAQGAVLATRLTGLALTEFSSFLRRSEVGIGVTLGVATFAALHLRPQLQATVVRLRNNGGPALERALGGMADAFERREAVDRRLQPTLVKCVGDDIPAAAVARLLAERWVPTPMATLHAALAARGSRLTVDQIAQSLRAEAAFHLVRGRGWQLGRVSTGSAVTPGVY